MVTVYMTLFKLRFPARPRQSPGYRHRSPRRTEQDRTFLRFSHLPTEVRLRIWTHAAADGIFLGLQRMLNKPRARSYLTRLRQHGNYKELYDCFFRYSACYPARIVPGSLFGVCRLERLVACEAFMGMVEGLSIWALDGHAMMLMDESKEEVIGRLGEDIKALKASG